MWFYILMSTLEDLRNIRLEKLDKLISLGINPYPATSYKDISNFRITSNFDSLEGKSVIVAGRIISIRKHGKLIFIDIRDVSGTIQLYIREEDYSGADYSENELKFADLDLLDVGDFVEASGVVSKTRRGEISVFTHKIRLLTKALRPIPITWDGLQDKETRLRRRYLDTNVNREVFERFIRRSKFWQAHRDFLNKNGFIEMDIPVLENIPGGADAKPFVTHMEALDQDFYLRISHELYLKRLIGGGYEKVYSIGERFRNEGLSEEHLPEHVAMEFYWAYADWERGMAFVQELFSYILDMVYDGKTVFNIRGFEVDFSKGWDRVDFTDLMKERYGIDVKKVSLKKIRDLLTEEGITFEDDVNLARGLDMLWKEVRKTLSGPIFLINHPKYISPLAKAHPNDPSITQRFQPIIAGSELGNGWSELNDPLDQFERFKKQQALRDAGDEEAQFMDIDFVEMLEYGMPPTFGYGHSERVFWFLEDVTAREGVPFPQMKYEIDRTTKNIYDLDNGKE